jgi:surfactin synthase thioesterase subunit
MVLGALLAYSAASYYAKKKGIPVEAVFSWSSCPCSNYTAAAPASEDEEDWIDMGNNDVIGINNQLLLDTSYSNGTLERIRRDNCRQSPHGKQQFTPTQ